MKPRTALAILTYVERGRPAAVRKRLPAAIASLERTGYRGPVVIVDDSSTCEVHQAYLDRLARSRRYDVVRRKANGGISRAKNTCLRAIAEHRADVGFLAEDDVLFRKGWDEAYREAMRRTKIQHFSWYVADTRNCVVACNGDLVTATGGMLGLLLTFTRDVVTGLGGFKVLPERYGYEHIQWTYRAVLAGYAPFACDIVDSERFVRRSELPSSLASSQVRAGINRNRKAGQTIDRLFEPLEE